MNINLSLYSYLFNIYPKPFFNLKSQVWSITSYVNPFVTFFHPVHKWPLISDKHFIKMLYFLSNHINTQFSCFLDLTVSDYPKNMYRFLCSYNICSPFFNMRVKVKVAIPNLYLNSITFLYQSASWYERECWDLFGIYFLHHIDLRRILNDYGFYGYPLKKDFPLSGFLEVYFSFDSKLVEYRYIKMVQEFRFYNTQSPWEYYFL